jgi:hypothetical protein
MLAMDLPALLNFEQVFAYVSTISGMDRYEILLQLRGHIEAGRLHPIGRRQGPLRPMAEIPPVMWVCYELDIGYSEPLGGLSECVARRRSDPRCHGPMLGWTAIRFPHEEILELWPERSHPQTSPKCSPKPPFSKKRAKEIFVAILKATPKISADDAISEYRTTIKTEGRVAGGNDALRAIFRDVLGPVPDRRGRPTKPKIIPPK